MSERLRLNARRMALGSGRASRLLIQLVIAACALSVGPALAQTVDTDFPVANGTVHSLAVEGDTLYVAGDFTRIARPQGSMVALDAATGATVSPWPRFRTRLIEGNFPQYASAVLPDGEGGCYVGGNFLSVSGVPRTGVAHVRGDGSLDGWGPVLNNWGNVTQMVRVGSTLYLGGSFTSAGGQPRNGFAAVDAASGALLPWDPHAAGPNGGSIQVSTMTTDGTRLFVAGTFESIGGQTRYRLAALDLLSGAAQAWNPSPMLNSDVLALVVGDGVVFAGGNFRTIGGQPRMGLAALDPWSGNATPWDAGASAFAQVWCLALSGPVLYVGGGFTQLGGAMRNGIAALDAGTALATGWQPPMYQASTWSIATAGADVYLGGRFTRVANQHSSELIAVDAATGTQTRWTAGADDMVRGVAIEGSRVFAWGAFADCGVLNHEGLAAIDLGTGSVLPWQPAIAGPVWCLAGAGPRLLVGGGFTSVDGQNRGGLAAFDRASGLVTAWNPSQGVPNKVAHLATDGQRAYVDGYANLTFPGQPASRMAAVDAFSGTALPWHPTIAGGDNYQHISQIIATGSRVYFSGEWQSVNGEPRRAVVAVDPLNGALLPWNPGLLGAYSQANGYIDAMALRGSRLYASGNFTTNGGTIGRGFAAFDTVSAQVVPWSPAIETSMAAIAANDSSVFFAFHGYDYAGALGKQSVLAAHPVTGAKRPWYPGAFGHDQNGPASLALHGEDVVVSGYPDLLADEYTRPGLLRIRPTDTHSPAAAVLSPSGGEGLVIGSAVTLQWQATDDQAVDSADLFLSRTGPAGPWELLAAGMTDTEAYRWTVTPPAASGNCWLRVDVRDLEGLTASVLSSGAFSIAYTTDVGPPRAGADFALEPPSPNPARGVLNLAYSLPRATHVRVSVVDVLGRESQRLGDGVQSPGRHVMRAFTDQLAPGLYFVCLRAPGVELARRFVVVR